MDGSASEDLAVEYPEEDGLRVRSTYRTICYPCQTFSTLVVVLSGGKEAYKICGSVRNSVFIVDRAIFARVNMVEFITWTFIANSAWHTTNMTNDGPY